MTRRQFLLVLFLAAGLAAWVVVRPGKAAHAGTPAGDAADCESAADSYGANDEETAGRRWATRQTRHWRYLVVQR
jgi:hypothetical protein